MTAANLAHSRHGTSAPADPFAWVGRPELTRHDTARPAPARRASPCAGVTPDRGRAYMGAAAGVSTSGGPLLIRRG